MAVVLAVGLGATAWAADDDDETPPARPPNRGGSFTNTLNRMFNGGDSGSKAKPPPIPLKKKAAPKAAEASKAAADAAKASADGAAAERAQAEAVYLRRQAVCLKLMQIAAQNNDAELQELAEKLDHQAWQLYAQRTAHLPAGSAGFESDEGELEKHLGAQAAGEGRPSALLAQPDADKNHAGRTASREVKP
jgi:hypothetical protein